MNTIRTKRLVLTTVTIADTVFLKQLFSFADVKKYYVLREVSLTESSIHLSCYTY